MTGGFGTVRRTASNLNDLLFSSSSLATAFAKDLRTFLFTDSGHTPTSLHRLIGLLCSDEVQRSIQGTSQTLLAAFFAARRKEAEERKLRGEVIADGDSILRISDGVLTKMVRLDNFLSCTVCSCRCVCESARTCLMTRNILDGCCN